MGQVLFMYQEYIKPFFDVVFAFVFIIVLSPILIAISTYLKITTKSSVIYKQKRVGKDGQYFNIYKFRTMVSDTPILVGDERLAIRSKVTKFGRLLRDTSLDELPQLFNVLRGEMSLIGPRPVVDVEYELLNLRQQSGVFKLKPGMTGLAQVNGRKNLTTINKAEFDAKYAKNVSLFLDISILLKTVPIIIVREGVQKLIKRF